MSLPAANGAPPWIGLLLSGFAGRGLRVQTLAREQAPRPVLTDHQLLMPPAILGDDAAQDARAAVAHAAAHLRYSKPHQLTAGLRPMTVAVVSVLEDVRVERLAMLEMPGLRRWWASFHDDALADGDLSFGAFVFRLSRVLFDPKQHERNHWVEKGRELFERQAAVDLLDGDAFRRIGSVLANDLGQMRVRFEPQQYRVEPAYRDDNSYLWTYAERADVPPPAEQALDTTPQLAAPKLIEAKASPDGEPQPEEIELGRYLVREWDYRIERHRRDWCTVVETLPLAPARATTSAVALPPQLPRTALARLNRVRRLRRQFEGDELDLDAAIEVMVDRRLGLAPDARIFRRPGREAPYTSLLVLLDLSESANDPVAGDGRPLLALEQEAALRLAQTVRGRSARVAVHGFNSNTREYVGYQRLLDFGSPFDASAAGRVSAARARYSTRIGAALRRATDLLADESSTRHTLLVVTDGAPSDIDVFDPRYLIEDARAAVQEAKRRGVHVQCVTLDPSGEPDARRIFGWQGYRVVTNPGTLAAHLRQVQARATGA
jgi:nitric oxide reductase NorD protein